MKEPTRADLTAAVARLTEENAGLRDMLAAVSEIAGSVPQAVYDQRHRQLDRARNFLITLHVVTDPGSTWAWGHASGEAAAHLRERAAEPADYEVYAEATPEPAQPGAVGTIVVDAADDSPCPVTGMIIGQIDEETVEVLWGERQFEENPGQGTYEPIDSLRPARQQPASVTA